jgi:hypothetical protein
VSRAPAASEPAPATAPKATPPGQLKLLK